VTDQFVITTDDAARAWLETAFAPTMAQWRALETYAAMLRAANAGQNLVAASTLDTIWARHIADSAQLLRFDDESGDGTWFDLGSGAGLPGLVIAILSERPMLLIESRPLRCAFLSNVIEALALGPRVSIAATPLERLSVRPAATISARAFAPLPKLINLSSRFSTVSTRWLLPKGRNAVNELALLPKPWQKLFHVEQSLTDADSGIIVGTGTVESWQKKL
jgi:16S rRNA (guanine527-N7)-methyltransferase